MCVRSTKVNGRQGTSHVLRSRYDLRKDHGRRNTDSNRSATTWQETPQVIFTDVSVPDLSVWNLYDWKRWHSRSCVWNRGISAVGGIPPGDCKDGFLSKMYLTSSVGTDMVFKDGRYLVVRDVTKLNRIAYPFELRIVTRTNNSSEIHTLPIHRIELCKFNGTKVFIRHWKKYARPRSSLCVCVLGLRLWCMR